MREDLYKQISNNSQMQNGSSIEKEGSENSQLIPKTQPQTTSDTSAIPPKPRHINKLLLTSLVLLIIAAITGGAYLYLQKQKFKTAQTLIDNQEALSPTPGPTTEWETYTNNKYSYSFSYKGINTLEFRRCGDYPTKYIGEENIVFMEIPNSYNICYPHDWIADIHILVMEGDKTTDLIIEKDYPGTNYEIQKEEIYIDNIKGYKISSRYIGEVDDETGMTRPDLTEIRIFNNNYTYFIYLGNEDYVETHNQILSTFKFLPDTSDWKTYRNEEFGFKSMFHPDLYPTEIEGSDDVGQFTYLFLARFGSDSHNPLQNPFGYSISIKQQGVEDIRLALIGHSTDRIDSEEILIINGNEWVLLNFQLFVTTEEIPVTSAIIQKDRISYEVTAKRSEIYQVLSTFEFIE